MSDANSNGNENADSEPTDAEVFSIFAAITEHLTDPENEAADAQKTIGMKYLTARKEVESLRLQLQEMAQDRDQLRQAVEDLDEQLAQTLDVLNQQRQSVRHRRANRISGADQ